MRLPSQSEETMMRRVAFELPHANLQQLGEIVGFVLGDGSINQRMITSFSNTEIYCIERMIEDCEAVFEVNRETFAYYLRVHPKSNEKQVERIWRKSLKVKRKILISYDKKIRKKFGIMHVHIKERSLAQRIWEIAGKLPIITNKSGFSVGFLRGFFAAEGAIIPGKVNKKIPNSVQFPQKGREVPELIKAKLDELGIESRVVIKQKKADYYCVNITGQENFRKFMELKLADMHPEKKQKLEIGLNSYRKPVLRKLIFPLRLLKELSFGPRTRYEIYDAMKSYPQRINGMLYAKTSYLVKNKLIEKNDNGGQIRWKITSAGYKILQNSQTKN